MSNVTERLQRDMLEALSQTHDIYRQCQKSHKTKDRRVVRGMTMEEEMALQC